MAIEDCNQTLLGVKKGNVHTACTSETTKAESNCSIQIHFVQASLAASKCTIPCVKPCWLHDHVFLV